MQDDMTPTARLLDHLLVSQDMDGVKDTVRLCMEQGLGYRQIASKLTEWTGHDTNYESVRRWARSWGLREDVAA